ncbi:thiamine pyrophosphate-binding protein [Gordonia polyisoprenivorans]|uniref:thiamine pyrophosphate-binding protein n=1 Tax=Gordonia polyisoprenivorans TaxID=84595 RepID=UPI001AD7B67A|nr:thiamine pyrophosphate-binding protein [Gordonia polyisoprenivorans]QTI68922.1 thiamine pyrophosphate-binding protein [Gordonia polyisoprenivorans]
MVAAGTVAECILEAAREHGISVVFGVHGANIEDVYATGAVIGMPMVVAKHEFAAGAMADGVARMTGRPGMVVTTSGGGALNVVAALAESYDSRVPVLAVIGAPPTPLTGRGAFQDMLDPPDTIDLTAVLGGVTGYCAVVRSAADLGSALAKSFATLRRGLPAALIVPKDVQTQRYDGTVSTGIGTADVTDAAEETSAALDTLATLLAERVIAGAHTCVWVGDEVSRSHAGETVSAIATMLGATIVAAPGGADAVTDLTTHAGVTGVMGHPSARRALADADVCLALGTRMTVTDRGGLDDVLDGIELYHVGEQPPRYPSKTVAVTSIAAALAQLAESAPLRRLRPRRPPRAVVEYLTTPQAPDPHLPDLPALMAAIDAHLPRDARVFADAGNAGAAALHHLTPRRSGRFTVALGMGGMGYAIAAGIGAAIDDPSRRSVVIAGDGAFFMHGMEFHTAVEHDAPVTLIVLNNNAHGMCVTRENLYFPEKFGINRFRSTDIAGAVSALFAGVAVRHPHDAAGASAACAVLFADRGPNCLVVECHSDEVPPFAPFLPREDSA